MRTAQRLQQHPRVQHVDDERDMDHGVIVTLKPGFEFTHDPGCGTRGFDSFSEALREVQGDTRPVRAPSTPQPADAAGAGPTT